MRNQVLFFFTLAVMAFVPTVMSHRGKLCITASLVGHRSLNVTQLVQRLDGIGKEKWYYVETDARLSWLDAINFCKFHGMELAAVSSRTELVKLEAIFKGIRVPDQYLWLSGMRMGEGKSSFYWMSNSEKVIFTNWESGFPSESACGNWCISTSLHTPSKWKDDNCMNEYAFVCEYYVD